MNTFSEPDLMIDEEHTSRRWLSQLSDIFVSPGAYAAALQSGDQIIYLVTSFEPAEGDGQLHYGYGVLMPGMVGDEYYMTRGHLHAHRPAAEVYICLRGTGLMLLEDERTGECRSSAMTPGNAVYVPGYTAHRTVNTGPDPLVYWGVYPYNAGHDYQAIQANNFQQVVVCQDGQPIVMSRSEYHQKIEHKP